MEEQVRRVHQLARLRRASASASAGCAVAERGDADARQQVEVRRPFGVERGRRPRRARTPPADGWYVCRTCCASTRLDGRCRRRGVIAILLNHVLVLAIRTRSYLRPRAADWLRWSRSASAVPEPRAARRGSRARRGRRRSRPRDAGVERGAAGAQLGDHARPTPCRRRSGRRCPSTSSDGDASARAPSSTPAVAPAMTGAGRRVPAASAAAIVSAFTFSTWPPAVDAEAGDHRHVAEAHQIGHERRRPRPTSGSPTSPRSTERPSTVRCGGATRGQADQRVDAGQADRAHAARHQAPPPAAC